jgi:UDP-glucose 4-epimerase
MAKTALVTGGAGFIGSAVVRVLSSAGYEARVAGTSSTTDPLDTSHVDLDVDVIVHCAGGSSVGAAVADPEADYAKTVPAYQELLARVTRARVVFLSSAAVYGHAAEVPTPESCPLAPVSPYGMHKQMCEELTLAFGERGGSAAIVRLFSVYGPGLRKQLLWDACRKARAGERTFAGTGDEQRDWLHIDDAVTLLLLAAEHASREVPIINGGSGIGARVGDVVAQIYGALGAGQPAFSGAQREGDPQRYVADITRAKALGWFPRKELAQGIREYVDWFREHG